MQNKQLQRQLKLIVQGLKGDQILRVIDSLQKSEGLFLNKNFTKSGINCTSCTLTHDNFVVKGFGRNQQQSLINAAKNYLQSLIVTNTLVAQLRAAIKMKDKTERNIEKLTERKLQKVQQMQEQKLSTKIINIPIEFVQNETLQLDEMKDVSEILSNEEKQGCNCVYYQVHKHHMTEIKNMQARMKLIMKQNQMLKQLILKDVKKDYSNKIYQISQNDKQNSSWRLNTNH